MKRDKLFYAVCIAAAVSTVLGAALSASEIFAFTAAFPFQQIGALISLINQGDSLSDGLALMLYVGVSLLPVWAMFAIKQKRSLEGEDTLLGVMSLCLFFVLYRMANLQASGDIQKIAAAVLGGVVWAVLAGYLALRALRLFFKSDTEGLWKYLKSLVIVLAFVFVIQAFGGGVSGCIAEIKSFNAKNTMPGLNLTPSHAFIIFGSIVSALPWVVDCITAILGVGLLGKMAVDRHSEESVAAGEKLAKWCKRGLGWIVVSNLGYNVLQLLYMKDLLNVSIGVNIPLFSICFVLAVLLFARMMEENRQLKEDSELII